MLAIAVTLALILSGSALAVAGIAIYLIVTTAMALQPEHETLDEKS